METNQKIFRRLTSEEYTEKIIKKIQKRNESICLSEDTSLKNKDAVYIKKRINYSKTDDIHYGIITISFLKSDLEKLVRKAMRFNKIYSSVRGDYEDIIKFGLGRDKSLYRKGNALILLGLDFSKKISEFSYKYYKLN